MFSPQEQQFQSIALFKAQSDHTGKGGDVFLRRTPHHNSAPSSTSQDYAPAANMVTQECVTSYLKTCEGGKGGDAFLRRTPDHSSAPSSTTQDCAPAASMVTQECVTSYRKPCDCGKGGDAFLRRTPDHNSTPSSTTQDCAPAANTVTQECVTSYHKNCDCGKGCDAFLRRTPDHNSAPSSTTQDCSSAANMVTQECVTSYRKPCGCGKGGDAFLRRTPDHNSTPSSTTQDCAPAANTVTQECVTSYPVKFLNKKEHITIHRSKLPHWHQNGKVQFITFRLADSLPKIKIDEWTALKEDWLKKHPEPLNEIDNIEYTNLFGEKFNQWLDAGYGKCTLSAPAIRNIVAEALFYYNSICYKIHAFVIMPNHVHILLSPISNINLTKIIGRIKGYTANKINKTLSTSGEFWQRSIFDRIVRNHNDFIKTLNYIKSNPSKLNKENYTLYVHSDI